MRKKNQATKVFTKPELSPVFLYNKRMEKIMKQHKIQQLLVSSPKSIAYYTGLEIDPQERFLALLIHQDGRHQIFSNALFLIEPTPAYEVIEHFDHENPVIGLESYLTGSTIGIDRWLRAEFVFELQQQFPEKTFVDGSDIIEGIQAIKTSEEIDKMKEASRLNDLVMEDIIKELNVGVTEKEIEEKLRIAFKKVGADGPSFDPIIAFGENGANPHAGVSDRALKAGESIVLDFGCIKDGYCSDMTRTYFLNENPLKPVYDLVLQAQLAAIEAIKPGACFADVDQAARQLIEAKGYGTQFFHRLGHGIGKEVHEPFDVSGNNLRLIQPGMCFSIEPGIYLEGVGGIRIEDLVYVDEQGYGQVLNHVPKDREVLHQTTKGK